MDFHSTEYEHSAINSGDTVLINDEESIRLLLQVFSPTLDCIKPLTIENIADHYATVVDVIHAPGGNGNIDDFAVLMLDGGQDFVLPLHGFRYVNVKIDEPEEEVVGEDEERLLRRYSTISQENAIVYHMAAEIIQSAYRRYIECKSAIKSRKVLSSENLVLNLAAETISRNLRKILKKKENQALGDEAEKHETRNHTNNSSSDRSIAISNLTLDDIPSIVWNESNSLYVVLECFDWFYRVETKYSAGKGASWLGKIASLSLKSDVDQRIKFYVYHECLAVQDKLIGVCDVLLSSIGDQLHGTLNCTLYDTMNVVKRKPRGNLHFKYTLCYDGQTPSNWQMQLKDGLSKLSGLESSSMSTKYVDVIGINVGSINGISASKVLAAAQTLRHCDSFPSDGSIPQLYSDSSLLEESKPLALNLSKLNNIEGLKNVEAQKVVASYNCQGADDISSPYATSRISNITDDVHSSSSIRKREVVRNTIGNSLLIKKTRTESIIGTHSRKLQESKQFHFPNKESSQTCPPFELKHSILYIFDKLFHLTLLKHSSSIWITLQEFIILLDSIGFSISLVYLKNALNAQYDSIDSDNISQELMKKVMLSINHPNVFAASVKEILVAHNYLLEDPHGDIELHALSPIKAGIAIDTIVKLVKGDYQNIRGMIFLASTNGKSDAFDTNERKKSSSKSVDTINAPINMIRPKNYNYDTIQNVIGTMKIHSPSISSICSVEDVNYPRNGQDLLNLTEEDMSNIFHIHSSLLKLRFILYQETLQLIESFWDRGVRPNDKIDPAKAKEKPLKKSIHVGSSSVASNNDRIILNYKLADAHALFHTYMPLNRAFGWGLSLSSITALCNSIGGFYAQQVSSSLEKDVVTGKIGYDGQNTVGENTILSHSKHMAVDDMIWVSVEFPTNEIKLSVFNILNPLQNELNHTLMQFKVLPRIKSDVPNQLANDTSIENQELYVNIPRKCCKQISSSAKPSDDLLQKPNILLEEDLYVGNIVRIISSHEKLIRLCEQFEWWDRPTSENLLSLTDQFVEIISTNELSTKGRVGVRLLSNKRGRICDALPTSALLKYDPNARSQFRDFQKLTKDTTQPNKSDYDDFSGGSSLHKKNSQLVSETGPENSPTDEHDKRKKRKKKRLKKAKDSTDFNVVEDIDRDRVVRKISVAPKDSQTNPDNCRPQQNEKPKPIPVQIEQHMIEKSKVHADTPLTRIKLKEQNKIETKDFSWLKATPPVINQVEVPNARDISPTAAKNQNTVDHELLRSQKLELDISNAVYTNGMVQSRPGTAPHGTRHSKLKTKHQVVRDVVESGPCVDTIGIEIAGFGYTDEGKIKSPPTSPFQLSPHREQKQNNEKPPTKKSNLMKVSNLFEYQERQKVDENPSNLAVNADAIPIGKSLYDRKMEKNKSHHQEPLPTETAAKNGEEIVEDVDSPADRSIPFQVEVKKKVKKHQKSLKEALLFEKEMARSAKEAEKKEIVLLRELKKLGIDTTTLQN